MSILDESRKKVAQGRADNNGRADPPPAPVEEKRESAKKIPAPPWQPFPVAALPEPARGYADAASRAIGCDPSYVALPLLAALASAIGNRRTIRLKRGWTEPAVLWTVLVGESGHSQKSGTGRAAKADPQATR
jgi:hypothetical protein